MHVAVVNVDVAHPGASSSFAAEAFGLTIAPHGSTFEQRIADGTYTADAHALARSFLEYLEQLAGPA